MSDEGPGVLDAAEIFRASARRDETVPVVGLNDLIRMKRARGRRIDLEDIAALTDVE